MEDIYLSAKNVAERIDSTVRTIENWAAASKITQNDSGKYGLVSAYKYQLDKVQVELTRTKLLLEESKAEVIQMRESSEEDMYSAKNRKAIAEANKEEALAAIKNLELKQLQGKLIDAEEVELMWLNIITTCVSKFQGVPAKLALQVTGIESPAEVEILLRENINENLSELGDISNLLEQDHIEE